MVAYPGAAAGLADVDRGTVHGKSRRPSPGKTRRNLPSHDVPPVTRGA
jgi:hypothetical protein